MSNALLVLALAVTTAVAMVYWPERGVFGCIYPANCGCR